MAPVVKIDYDSTKFPDDIIRSLGEELHQVVSRASNLPLTDASVFANSNQITVNAAPMEIYINAGSGAIPNSDKQKMLDTITTEVKKFKAEKGIEIPVNISIVEMTWKVGVGI